MGEEGVKWSGAVCCSRFLEETSERHRFSGTGSAKAESAYRLNRVPLAGPDVETMHFFSRIVNEAGQ